MFLKQQLVSLLLFVNNTAYEWSKTCVTVEFQQYNLCVEQLVLLLLYVNNTIYVSNNSCPCCCFSTNYNLCVKQLVSLLLFVQQRSSLFQTAPRLMLIVFASFFFNHL